MSYRIVLLTMFFTGILSALSFFSLLLYFDPYTNKLLAFTLIILSYELMFINVIAFIIYFIKKIYYRGISGMYYIYSSLRQAFLISLLPLAAVFFIAFSIPVLLPLLLFVALLMFIEIFISGF